MPRACPVDRYACCYVPPAPRLLNATGSSRGSLRLSLTMNATGLPRGSLRLLLRAASASALECHGLVPWIVTFVANDECHGLAPWIVTLAATCRQRLGS